MHQPDLEGEMLFSVAAVLLSFGGCKKEVDLSESYQPRPVSVPLDAVGEDDEGRWVTGVATVSRVISDRAFFLGERPNRLLVVVQRDPPDRSPIAVRVGDRIRATGMVLDASFGDRLAGEPLDAAAERAIASSPRFLAVHRTDLGFLERGDAAAPAERPRVATMSPFADADADADRRVTKDELKAVLTELDRPPWDANVDGVVDPTEAGRFLFLRLDPDGDGRILTSTFDAQVSRWYGGRDVPPGEAWDTDGDGWIVPDEFERQITALPGGVWDTDGDGTLSEEEIAVGVLTAWDLDQSGYLDQHEYTLGRDHVMRSPYVLSSATLSRFDLDRSGTIDRREFDRWADEYGEFDAWDTDRDRALTRAELAGAVFHHWDLDRNVVIERWEFDEVNAGWHDGALGAWARWDANRDGRLTRREFARRIGEADDWAQWDADGDGSVSEEEYRDRLFRLRIREGEAMEVDAPAG